MPNFKEKAFKKAQDLLQQHGIASDTSSESEESVKSEEYSHIPIPNLNLSLETLRMESQSGSNPQQGVSAISEQLAQIMRAIEAINHRQNQYELRLNSNNAPTVQNVQEIQSASRILSGDPFRIPDPIKMLPTFNGNKKQLSNWLDSAEKTLKLFEERVDPDIFEIYLATVINKIEGQAKDILCTNGNPKTFDDVRKILIESLGDKQELSTYNCLLWHNKMDGNPNKHYQKTKELINNIKSLAKQNPKYNYHWDGINDFIDEYSLAAYVGGLEKPYFGYVQAAKPKNIEDAYAFICKFTSLESNKSLTQTNMPHNKQELKPGGTGHRNNSFPKSNHPKTAQSLRQDSKSHKPNESRSLEKSVEPMDIGSTRSKLTLNKRQINNTEFHQSEDYSDSERENYEEDVDINFCSEQQNQTGT